MATVGISTVRNEADIIADTVGWMLTQVDHVIVADNLSTDGTYDILESLPITLLADTDPAHRQSEKMSALADRVRVEFGPDTWVVPFDADEVWYSPFGTLAERLGELDGFAMATADLYDHVATAADPDLASPVRRIGWRRRTPLPLPKVAVRAVDGLVIEDGNHGARFPRMVPASITGQLVIRHFPYRSAEQMERKAMQGSTALKAAGRDRSVGAHWHAYADLAEAGLLGHAFYEHFYSADPAADPNLIYDPAPCQS